MTDCDLSCTFGVVFAVVGSVVALGAVFGVAAWLFYRRRYA